MAFEIVTLSAGGLTFRPATVAIKIAMDEAARSFEAKIKHLQLGQAALLDALKASPACTIRSRASDGITFDEAGAGGDLILTGHVEKRSPRLQGEEKELLVAGRSKTGDLVDSSAEHETGEFRGKQAPEILNTLARAHGVKIETDAEHRTREQVRIRPGETVFRFAERLARVDGVTLTDTPQGNLRLTRGGTKRHAGEIRDGAAWPALVDASAVHDDSKRHSEIKVRAQAPDGYAPDKLTIEESAVDDGMRRHRPRVIVPPEQMAKKDARDRAKWHRDRAAGEGTTAEITVKGWRDAAGALWTPGHLVTVTIADLGLAQDMQIKAVSLEQSDAESGGTQAKLSLVDPRAFGGKKGKGGKSGASWDLGKSGAEDA